MLNNSQFPKINNTHSSLAHSTLCYNSNTKLRYFHNVMAGMALSFTRYRSELRAVYETCRDGICRPSSCSAVQRVAVDVAADCASAGATLVPFRCRRSLSSTADA